jgi:hypothetical protein
MSLLVWKFLLLIHHSDQHFQVSSFINQPLAMLSASRVALATLILGNFIYASATSFDFRHDVLRRVNTRDANLTAAVRVCTGNIADACDRAPNGEGCGFEVCSPECLGLFPLLSNCCTSQEGYDLNVLQVDECMYQYAVWTTDGNGDVVSIYPSLTRPAPSLSTSTDIETITYSGFVSTRTDIYTHADVDTTTVPIPFASGATSVAATTSGATASATKGSDGATTSPPSAMTTTTSGSQSHTNAAASGPTTSNAADKFTASNGQQLGFFGAVFMGMMSLFLL